MKSLGRKDAKYDLLIIMTKKKNKTNTKTKTQTKTKTKTLKKTIAKYRKDHTCAIFSKSRWRKDIIWAIILLVMDMSAKVLALCFLN